MNCVLFTKMDQVFSQKNKPFKKYWENGKNIGKVREIFQFGEVGIMYKW